MKRGFKIIKVLNDNSFEVVGLNNNKSNTISKKTLAELIGKGTIINQSEQNIILQTVDIEPYDEGYDVNVIQSGYIKMVAKKLNILKEMIYSELTKIN